MTDHSPGGGPYTRCPHCGAQAVVLPSTRLRWKCGVCGAPVVPTGGAARAQGELPHLVRAHRARAMGVGWMAAAVLFAVVAVMTGGLAALLWTSANAAALALTVLAAAAMGLGLASRARSARHTADARAQVDQAWQKAADEVLQGLGGEATAAGLARAMHTDEAHAEQLLAGLSAGGRARVEVRDDAELSYRIEADAAESEPTEPTEDDAAAAPRRAP